MTITNKLKNTLEETEFLDKYGDLVVTFDYYRKYTFRFACDVEGQRLEVIYGGDDDLIYESDIDTKPVKIRDVDCMLIAAWLGKEKIYGD